MIKNYLSSLKLHIHNFVQQKVKLFSVQQNFFFSVPKILSNLIFYGQPLRSFPLQQKKNFYFTHFQFFLTFRTTNRSLILFSYFFDRFLVYYFLPPHIHILFTDFLADCESNKNIVNNLIWLWLWSFSSVLASLWLPCASNYY